MSTQNPHVSDLRLHVHNYHDALADVTASYRKLMISALRDTFSSIFANHEGLEKFIIIRELYDRYDEDDYVQDQLKVCLGRMAPIDHDKKYNRSQTHILL